MKTIKMLLIATLFLMSLMLGLGPVPDTSAKGNAPNTTLASTGSNTHADY